MYKISQKLVEKLRTKLYSQSEIFTLLIKIFDQGNYPGRQVRNDVDYTSHVAVLRGMEQICTNREKRREPYSISEEKKHDVKWRDGPGKMIKPV